MKPDRQPFRKYVSRDSDSRNNTVITLIEAKTPNPDPADGQVLSRESEEEAEWERMRVSRAADKQATKFGGESRLRSVNAGTMGQETA
ncbi:hypothetical protein ABHI18_005792 [Aspergillus niger]